MSYVLSDSKQALKNNGVKIRLFTDLHAWQEAHKLVILIYQITKQLPKKEQYSLTDQIQRAAVSVTSNIAEGFRKRTHRDKNKFYRIALASLAEVENQLIVIRDIYHINNEDMNKCNQQAIRSGKLITGLLKSSKKLS